MANEDCAIWLVELYADYFELSSKYGRPVIDEYAEAVAKATMALAERGKDCN